jgi:acyl-CoA-binding protein
MSEAFNNAVTAINATKHDPKLEKITNDEKLSLYGLFKQASSGDNTAAAPWAVQL